MSKKEYDEAKDFAERKEFADRIGVPVERVSLIPDEEFKRVEREFRELVVKPWLESRKEQAALVEEARRRIVF